MEQLSVDVVVTRGSLIESRHRVHAIAVDAGGAVLGLAGDPQLVSHWRSCAKPFQVMSLLEQGGFDTIGWGDDQLALACGSHGGEPEHVALAAGMLTSIGMEEGDLACGPHEPLSARGQRVMRESGERPTRLHNNCSGKHAAMLAKSYTAGWPTVGYERLEHPVQQECLQHVAQWSGVDASAIGCAVDGCGVVVFALPLQARPFLVGGSDRFDSAIIEATKGRVITKVGAEGVHSIALIDEGIGMALKVECGAQRAQYPAVIALLQRYGALPENLPPSLIEFARRVLRNTRGEAVGEVRPLVQ
jgi:L-asparaginase II